MPSIPVYNSQRQIQAGTSQPLRNEAAQKGADDQLVIGSIQEATQKWSDAHDVMQLTESKLKHETALADIQSRAAADPDFKNSAKYYKELEDAKKVSLTGISNKAVQEQLSMEMDFGNQVAAIKIDTNFKAKELATNKFNLSKQVELMQQKKVQATTAAEAMNIDQEMKDLLEKNITAGTVTLAEAEKIENEANKTSAEFVATVYPDQFMANGAKYYGIPEDEYRKLKETARLSKDRAKEEGIKAQKELQTTTETDLIMNLANQEIDRLSVPEITRKMMNGDISTEFGEAYIKVLTSPKHIASGKKNKVKYGSFHKYAKEIFATDSPEAIKKAVVNMLDGAAEGNLDQDELGLLIKVADKAGKKKRWISGVIDGVIELGMGSKYSEQRMVVNVFKALAAGKDPDEAKIEAIDQEQIEVNPNRTKYIKDKTYTFGSNTFICVGYNEKTGDPEFKEAK